MIGAIVAELIYKKGALFSVSPNGYVLTPVHKTFTIYTSYIKYFNKSGKEQNCRFMQWVHV